MNTKIENFEKETFELDLFYSHLSSGAGHWKIKVDVSIDSSTSKSFYHTTTDSMWIDELSDLRADNASHEEIQAFYHDRFYDNTFEEMISEWAFSLEDENE